LLLLDNRFECLYLDQETKRYPTEEKNMVADFVCGVATDPFCGASFDQDKAGASYDFQGFTYYFCSPACKDRFAEATLAGINS
jgi:YHS domain-containing protein